MKVKKNCHNCAELEWIHADSVDGYDTGSGFTCNKRLANEFNQDKESRLLKKLEKDEYREKPKRCFEPKPQ